MHEIVYYRENLAITTFMNIVRIPYHKVGDVMELCGVKQVNM